VTIARELGDVSLEAYTLVSPGAARTATTSSTA
jgi:hypothetical protein